MVQGIVNPVKKDEQGMFLDIRESGYCLLLEFSVQSAWPGPILFKGPTQTSALNPHEPCLRVH